MRAFSSLARVAMLRRISVVFTTGVVLLSPCAAADAGESVVRLFSEEMRQIEANSVELQSHLTRLPPAPVPQATARLGWHSIYRPSDAKTEWVELNLGEAQVLDAVVLIAPPPNGGTVGAGYGFPHRFYVELIGEGEESSRTIIAEHTEADFPNPGTLPVVLPAGGRLTQKVRITATRLFGEKERYFFALGEVMLLQGKENLGARIERIGPEQVIASSSQGTRPDWGRINLVDGHNALGPPLGTQRSPTLGFHSGRISERLRTDSTWVELDLGHATLVDEVRLFPAHPPNFAHTQGYGFPVRYQIELREEVNAAPVVLPAPQSGSYAALPGNNVIAIPGGHPARHVRLTAVEPHVSNGSAILALAEMQVWSGGQNIATGARVTASGSQGADHWSNAALVDGFTSIANILEWPEWLAGLSQRREIEHQLGTLAARREAIVRSWQQRSIAAGFVALLASVAAFLIWLHRQRRARLREMESLRQRIARDLHDEIGSSLGGIALIAQDILASSDDPAQTHDDLIEIKTIADESVAAMRDITRLIQSDRYGSDDLATLLRETAARLLRTIPHTVILEGASSAHKLPVDRQRDLILMFKEALHNITRHAAATAVEIRLVQSSARLSVALHDNGCGFDPAAATEGMGLTNLQRRAAKHGGTVRIDSAPAQGTTLTITLPVRD